MKFYINFEEVTKEEAIEKVGFELVNEGIEKIKINDKFATNIPGFWFEVER